MAKTFEEIVGRNLNRILYDKKVNQKVLAEAVGISGAAMSKMVNGTKVVSAEKLAAIAKYLKIPLEELTK